MTDKLAPARGILLGVVIGTMMWAFIVALVFCIGMW